MFAAATKSVAGLKVTVQTFTSSTTWVAPANVSNIITLTGQGGSGIPGSWSIPYAFAYGWATGYSFSTGAVAPYTWDALYAQVVAHQSAVNAGGSGSRAVTYETFAFQIYADGASNNYGSTYTNSYTATVRGTASITSRGSPPSSGTITYAQILNQTRGWELTGIEVYNDPTTGDPTIAFGYTFPGGTGGAATPATYNNVAVTPGASYSLVIPSGGSVSITYIG